MSTSGEGKEIKVWMTVNTKPHRSVQNNAEPAMKKKKR